MERITVDDLDILMLRSDPANETGTGPGLLRPVSILDGLPCGMVLLF